MTTSTKNLHVSEQRLAELARVALAQGKTPDELADEAIGTLLRSRLMDLVPEEEARTEAELAGYFEAGEWEAAKRDGISLSEVRAALSSIEGSLSDAVVASREER